MIISKMLLYNFSCREITKENWVDEIRDDVIDECTKYGGIVHIHVDQVSPDGRIYLKCPTIAVATSVMGALSGRYFSGKFLFVFLVYN
jgi:RNA-binding protein 39